jgi:NADH-quinone oxidoreductase subunit G
MKADTAERVDLVNIEVDGIPLQAPKGSMIIQATDKAGIDIPRFCYHRKLSIAANCRMCLVDVEKAPKPMPACATPVMEGMKIFTQSRRAIDAQHGVMEFLLINHPLDCPICDQGGECELQDLAMGYGRSVARFTERKRVVKDKNVGPLVQTDMTRCIHCTRCVRFLEEIAGTSEMGGSGRGDRLEIGTCVENSIDSELSGNIIDLCPVGALTDKPFRFAARAWELVARPSVGVHDGVGSLLYHHVRRGRILRSVPRDNESTNETWLSDRDRYSHAGLYADDRVLEPMVKKDGEWQAVSWDEAIKAAIGLLRRTEESPGQLCALMSGGAATEEYFLTQRLVRALGSDHIDHRLREQDFSDDDARPVSPEFAVKTAELEEMDAVLLVGCNPRHEAPILGHRLRQAWRRGATLMSLNPLDWEFIFETRQNIVVAPQFMVAELAAVAAALAKLQNLEMPAAIAGLAEGVTPEPRHHELAGTLVGAEQGLVMLGHFAMSHHRASDLRRLAAWIASNSQSALNLLSHGANSTGAWQAGAVPHRGPAGQSREGGMNKSEMIRSTEKTWLLWDLEPDFDVENPAAAVTGLRAAKEVLAISSFASDSLKQLADIILPLAPIAESEGSLVNLDGTTFRFAPAGKALGAARPGWKILRRLGDEMGLEGFGQINLQEVHEQMQAAIQSSETVAANPDSLAPAGQSEHAADSGNSLYRIGEVPIYSVDALCRRAPALQQTAHAASDFVGLNPADAENLGLADGVNAKVLQGDAAVELAVRISNRVPVGAAWVRSATCRTAELGSATGPVKVEVPG